MKLICVSQAQQTNPSMTKIPILDEVTVIGEKQFAPNEYWQFEEYAFRVENGLKIWQWYDKRDFATLPEATADEMQEAEKEAILM